MTRRVLTGMAAGLLATVALVGCGAASSDDPVRETSRSGVVISEQRVTLVDGRVIICLSSRSGAGLSCDWPGASLP